VALSVAAAPHGARGHLPPETAATEITYAGGRVKRRPGHERARYRDARGRLLRVRAARRTSGDGVRPRAPGRRSAAGLRAPPRRHVSGVV
jgi:hypothetical protein